MKGGKLYPVDDEVPRIKIDPRKSVFPSAKEALLKMDKIGKAAFGEDWDRTYREIESDYVKPGTPVMTEDGYWLKWPQT